MLNKQEHNAILSKIKREGVPSKYPTTIMGNYKPDTVVDIMAEILQNYRDTELNKLKKNTQ